MKYKNLKALMEWHEGTAISHEEVTEAGDRLTQFFLLLIKIDKMRKKEICNLLDKALNLL